MKKGKRVLFVVVAVLLAGLGAAARGGHHHPDPERMERFVSARIDDVLDDVDATDAQRQRIEAIRDRMFTEARAAGADRAEVRREFVDQLASPSPDAARLHALVDARAEKLRALAHRAVDAAIEVHGILTPEQRAELEKKIRRHFED